MEKEISILSSFEHPNIVRFIGMKKLKGEKYMIMEFMNGGSLLQYIRNFEKSLNEINLQKKSKVWIVIYSVHFNSNFILEGNYERTCKKLMLIINGISFLFQDSLNSIEHTTY